MTIFIDMMSRAIGQGRLMAVHGMFNGEYVCTDMGHSKKSCDWGCIQTYYDCDVKLNTRNRVLVWVISSRFHQNSANSDKSMIFGIRLHFDP